MTIIRSTLFANSCASACWLVVALQSVLITRSSLMRSMRRSKSARTNSAKCASVSVVCDSTPSRAGSSSGSVSISAMLGMA